MSSIIERAFDKTQKIVRAVFKGAPNLITTSDLNRQFEAMKYQMDSIEGRVGVVSDLTLDVAFSDNTWNITPKFSYLEAKGAAFSPSKGSVSLYANGDVYLCLTAERATVTYSDDFSHKIAGASFTDGTSAASADQIVYKNEALVLTANPNDLENLIAVVAKCTAKDTDNISTIIYAIPNNGTLQDFVAAAMKPMIERITALETLTTGRLVGVGYMMLWSKSLTGKTTLESVKASIPFGFVPCHKLPFTTDAEFTAWSEYATELGYTLVSRGSGASRYINFSEDVGVPLMDGRLPFGASTEYELNSIGGNLDDFDLAVEIKEENLPAHTHVYSGTTNGMANATAYTKSNGETGTYIRQNQKVSDNVANGADGNDNSTAAFETTSVGKGKALNYKIPNQMPPYIALYFIIRVTE